MPRYRLEIEYDGADYAGFQRQADRPSIQGAIEAAALAFSGEAATPIAAGRTDAGVHALAMTIHLDFARDWRPEVIANALNAHLRPQPIAVLRSRAAPAEFHARFSCVQRRYRYRIALRRAPLALDRGRAWRRSHPLDPSAMRAAAALLTGRHDFTSFRASACQASSPIKTLDALEIIETDAELHILAAARSFLHHQVRNIASALERVGAGKLAPEEVSRILAARDRRRAPATAPACGLYFLDARYPEEPR